MWDLNTINRINQTAAKLTRHQDFPVRDAVALVTEYANRKKLEELEQKDKEVSPAKS